MMIFEVKDGNVKPLAPNSKAVDGVTIFDLPGAAKATGRDEAWLIALYKGAFADSLPSESITGEAMGHATPARSDFTLAMLAMSEQQKDELVRLMLYPTLPAKAFQAFKIIAQQRKLSIFCRHLYPQYRLDGGEMKLVIVTTIEAVRLLARRSPAFKGAPLIEFKAKGGEWVTEWDSTDGYPKWARCTAYREGDPVPTTRVVEWDAYVAWVKTDRGFEVDPMWAKWSWKMLGKCAEVDAIRAVCPEEVEGIYTLDEMRQRDNFQPTPSSAPVLPSGPSYESDSQLPAVEDSQVTDYIEADEFQALFDAAIPDPDQQKQAMIGYKAKYRKVYAVNPAAFHTMMAVDLRALMKQPPN